MDLFEEKKRKRKRWVMDLFEEKKRKRKQWAKGFEWGKREHKFETLTTKWLIAGIILLIGAIYLEFWLDKDFSKDIFFIVSIVFAISLIFRFISSYSHKKEKVYMDKLRFKRKKEK